MILEQTYDSNSSDSKHRAAFNTETGTATCTCRGARSPKGCWHLRDIAAKGAAIAGECGAQADVMPTARERVGDAASSCPVKPMLASALTRGQLSDYMNTAWLLEEKFDGLRIVIAKQGASVVVWSRPRSGKDALRCSQWTPALEAAVLAMPDGVFDGELVVPGGRSWDVARLENAAKRRAVLFDVIELLGKRTTGLTYRERRELLGMALDALPVESAPFLRMPATEPVCLDAVQAIWQRGGEGAILKRASSTYQPGRRSPDWVKVKKAGSAVLTIIGFEAGKTGPYATVRLRAADGSETTVKTKDNATYAAIAADPAAFIGRRLVIAYCELTDDGKFRHGVFDHFAGEGE